MRAELVDGAARFEVQPRPREDGTTGPPASLNIALRPCWRKPTQRLTLALLYELDGVAYYAAVKSEAQS